MDWLGQVVNGFIGDLFTFLAEIVNGLFGALGFPSLRRSVFGVEPGNPSLGYVSAHGPFDAIQWAGLMHIETLFVEISWALVALLLAWLAYRMMNVPDARAAGEVTSLAWRLGCIGLMVSLVPWGVDQILAANDAMADSIAAWDPSAVDMFSANVLSAAAQVSAQPGMDSGALLAIDGLLKLAIAVLRLVIAVLLVERMLVLAALLVVGPVVCWSWVWNPRGTAWGLWLSEIVSLAFIPASLAIVAAAMQALFWSSGGVAGWARLASLMFMVPAAGLLRKLITGFFGLIGMREDRTAMGVAGSMLAAGMAGGAAALGGVGRTLLPGAGGGPKPGGPGGPGGAVGGAVRGAGGAAGAAGAAAAAMSPGLPGAGRLAGGGAQAPSAGPRVLGPDGRPTVPTGGPGPSQAPEERLRRALAYGAGQGRDKARQAGWVRAASAVTGAAGAVAGGAAVAGLHLAGVRLNHKEAVALAGKAAAAGREVVAAPAGAAAATWRAGAEYQRERRASGADGLPGQQVAGAVLSAATAGPARVLEAAQGLHRARARQENEAARRERWLSGLDGPEFV